VANAWGTFIAGFTSVAIFSVGSSCAWRTGRAWWASVSVIALALASGLTNFTGFVNFAAFDHLPCFFRGYLPVIHAVLQFVLDGGSLPVDHGHDG